MNVRTTIVLAVLAAAAFGAWFLIQPEEESTVLRPRPFDWRESNFRTITIRIPEKPDLVLRRQPAVALGSQWHLEKPAKPVDDALVQDMIAALNRLSREKSIKPGDPEYTPSVYGLDKPEVTVDVTGITEKRTIKFGNVSNRQPDYRFYMVEGDPEIYYGPANAVPSFKRSISELRSRIFFVLDAARVMGVELSSRYLKAGQDIPKGGKTDYEKQKFVFRSQPTDGAKGWYIVEVDGEARNEKAEDVKLAHLISGLRDMKAEEYAPITDPAEFGFKDPELIARLDILQPPSNDTKPMVIEVGRTIEKSGRKLTYVRVDGSDEAALVNAAHVERIPRERKQFISLDLFDIEAQYLEEVDLVADTGHKVLIRRRDEENPRGDEKFKQVFWDVKEPAGLPAEPTSVNDFISWLMRVTISNVLGEQPDLATFGLDKPALTLTLVFRPKSGVPQTRVFKIGRPGNSGPGFLLKQGSREIFEISEDIWRRFDRTDLNFRKLELFNTSNTAIVGMSFTYRPDHLSANPVKYSVRRVAAGKWEFDDPELRRQGAQVDQDRMEHLAGTLSYIRAEGFLTRNPKMAEEYKLDDSDPSKGPMGRLTIKYADPANPGKSAEKVLRFSKSFLDDSGRIRLYYAKFEPVAGDTSPSSDATIVFRIKTELVETLRGGVVYEAKAIPDTGKPPPKKDDDKD
jgi:hypothetical protein